MLSRIKFFTVATRVRFIINSKYSVISKAKVVFCVFSERLNIDASTTLITARTSNAGIKLNSVNPMQVVKDINILNGHATKNLVKVNLLDISTVFE